MPKASEPVATRLARLRRHLDDLGSALVAFSGGVDSTFLLKVASEQLGSRCLALTTESPSTPAHDREGARRLAADFGVTHVVVDTNELDMPEYAANPVNRCWFCKDHLFAICERERAARGLAVVLDGANVDDLGDHRPGLDAAARRAVRHPLVEAGFDKAAVRTASRALGLPTWDRPASPCLSSRIPYGTPISAEALARVDAAERFLRALGFVEVRVRAHDQLARIEVPAADVARLAETATRDPVVDELRRLGFRQVTVDLRGFRSGSLNEGVPGADTGRPRTGTP
jgi:uncharacterized protein